MIFPEETVGLAASVAENGSHFDAIFHVHKTAGLRDHGFCRIQFHFHGLHFLAEDFVVNFVIS
jgi:hypothetical protein